MGNLFIRLHAGAITNTIWQSAGTAAQAIRATIGGHARAITVFVYGLNLLEISKRPA
jgi:hypothetical protein